MGAVSLGPGGHVVGAVSLGPVEAQCGGRAGVNHGHACVTRRQWISGVHMTDHFQHP